MNKKIKSLLLLVILPIITKADPISMGLLVSATYSNVGELESVVNAQNSIKANAQAKPSYSFGAWLNLDITPTGGFLGAVINYSSRRTDYDLEGGNKGEYTSRVLEIPIYYGKQFFKILRVGIGPSFSIPIKSVYEVTSGTLSEEIENSFGNNVDLAGFAGLSLGRIGVRLSFTLPLINEGEQQITSNIQTVSLDPAARAVSLGVSYKLK